MHTLHHPKKTAFSEGTVILDPEKKYQSVKSYYNATRSADPNAATLFRDQLELILEFLYQKRSDYTSFRSLDEKMKLDELYKTIMSEFNELTFSIDDVHQKIKDNLSVSLVACPVKEGHHFDFFKRRVEELSEIEYGIYRNMQYYETGVIEEVNTSRYLNELNTIKSRLVAIAKPFITKDDTLTQTDRESLLTVCEKLTDLTSNQIKRLSTPLTSPVRTPVKVARLPAPGKPVTERVINKSYPAVNPNQNTSVITGNLFGGLATVESPSKEQTQSINTDLNPEVDSITDSLSRLGLYSATQANEQSPHKQDTDDEFEAITEIVLDSDFN